MGKNIYSIRGAQKIWIKDKSIQLYIASRSLSMKDKQELIDLCFQDGIKVKEISTYSEMLREKEISLKDLNISDLIIRKNLVLTQDMLLLECYVFLGHLINL